MSEQTRLGGDEYWMLECYGPPEEDFTGIASYPSVEGGDLWVSGSRFDRTVPEPIRLEWDPEAEGPLKALYKPVIPLFRRDLLDAVRAAGVDNLDCYRAEILDTKTGRINHDYMAVNIIGVVAVADLEQSVYEDPWGQGLIDMDFDSLVIDPKKAGGRKLFRLAECVSGIVIHRSVKEYLESKGGFGLSFVHPSEWIG